MTILAVIPTQREFDALVRVLAETGHKTLERPIGRLSGLEYHGGKIMLAQGGLEKAQMAVHTQHLIEHVEDLGLVVCAGTAGGLLDTLAAGDVVIATATIEHDFKWGLVDQPQPRFEGHVESISALMAAGRSLGTSFQVQFGPVASGDEAVIDSSRATQIREATGAFAVAFEGAGGARACEFSNVPFLEVRGISDLADEAAPEQFLENIPIAMGSVASVLQHIATMLG